MATILHGEHALRLVARRDAGKQSEGGVTADVRNAGPAGTYAVTPVHDGRCSRSHAGPGSQRGGARAIVPGRGAAVHWWR